MRAACLSCIFLIPLCASVQFRDGMVPVNGAWEVPTTQTALDVLWAPESRSGSQPAIAVLRQVFDERSAGELDAFADNVGRIFRYGPEEQSSRAFFALQVAAMEIADYPPGIPYTRARDVFLQAFESLVHENFERARTALFGLMRTGGEEYPWKIFESSEPPEKPCWPPGVAIPLQSCGQPFPDTPPIPPEEEWCPYKDSVWCTAGELLVLFGENKPDEERVMPTCFSSVQKDDGTWVRVIF